ncbi:MAG: hypothetical protein ACXWT1_02440 [Methylobacter sp.]
MYKKVSLIEHDLVFIFEKCTIQDLTYASRHRRHLLPMLESFQTSLENKNMRAIEFQATAHQHLLRLPDTIPDGVPLRVLLLLDEDVLSANPQVRRKPSPKLAGTVTMQDDLIAPAIPDDDWDALQ